jgi:hypothetical protein
MGTKRVSLAVVVDPFDGVVRAEASSRSMKISASIVVLLRLVGLSRYTCASVWPQRKWRRPGVPSATATTAKANRSIMVISPQIGVGHTHIIAHEDGGYL